MILMILATNDDELPSTTALGSVKEGLTPAALVSVSDVPFVIEAVPPAFLEQIKSKIIQRYIQRKNDRWLLMPLTLVKLYSVYREGIGNLLIGDDGVFNNCIDEIESDKEMQRSLIQIGAKIDQDRLKATTKELGDEQEQGLNEECWRVIFCLTYQTNFFTPCMRAVSVS